MHYPRGDHARPPTPQEVRNLMRSARSMTEVAQ
jgi:hypothetical protein